MSRQAQTKAVLEAKLAVQNLLVTFLTQWEEGRLEKGELESSQYLVKNMPL